MKPTPKHEPATKRNSNLMHAVPLWLGTTAAVLPWLLGVKSSSLALLLYLNLAICAFPLIFLALARTRPAAIVVLAFLSCWLGLAPIYQVRFGVVAWGERSLFVAPHLVSQALAINIVAVASLLFGIVLHLRTARAAQDVPQLTRGPFSPASSGVLRSRSVRGHLLYVYLFLGLLLAPGAIAASGGLGNMFSSRSSRGAALVGSGADGGGLFSAINVILPACLASGAFYLSAIMLMEKAKLGIGRGGRAVYLAPFLTSLTLCVLFANPWSNTRFLSLLAFAPTILLVLRPLYRRGSTLLAIVFVTLFLAIYPLANAFRGTDSYRERVGGWSFLGSADFDGFQQVANTYAMVRSLGHSDGIYIASSILYFVPRSIWPMKAIPASIDVATWRGYSFTNLSLPLPAELYLEWGLFGVVICMALLGYFLGILDTAWKDGNVSRAAYMSPVTAIALIGLFRGPLGAQVPVALTALLLVAVALKPTSRKRRFPAKWHVSSNRNERKRISGWRKRV